MSFLRNPSFELGNQGWSRINQVDAVTYRVIKDESLARSGSHVLTVSTSADGGSIGQDATIPGGIPSISCFAWIRGRTHQVRGTMTIWHMANPDYSIDTPFDVGPTWTLITNSLAFNNPAGNKNIRVEFYVGPLLNRELCLDSVNAF